MGVVYNFILLSTYSSIASTGTLYSTAELLFVDGDVIDVSEVNVYGNTIRNWDYNINENYDEPDIDGKFSRACSLSELLELSSNTAPIRLTQDIGFKKAYQYMNSLYQLNRPLNTEINSLTV